MASRCSINLGGTSHNYPFEYLGSDSTEKSFHYYPHTKGQMIFYFNAIMLAYSVRPGRKCTVHTELLTRVPCHANSIYATHSCLVS